MALRIFGTINGIQKGENIGKTVEISFDILRNIRYNSSMYARKKSGQVRRERKENRDG